MASFVQAILRNVSQGYLFSRVTHYVNPELLSSVMFFGILLASDYFSYEFIEGFSNYVIIEFLMIHSNVGMAVAIFFATTEAKKKLYTILTGSFYFLFILAMAFGMGAWWTALVFILLTYSRIVEPLKNHTKDHLIGEIVITFIRFAIYMLSAVAAFLIGDWLLEVDDTFSMMIWGGVYYLVLFFMRNVISGVKGKLFNRKK